MPSAPQLFVSPKGRVLCNAARCRSVVAKNFGDDEVTGATAVTDDQAVEWFATIGNLISCSVCGARHESGAIGQRERGRKTSE